MPVSADGLGIVFGCLTIKLKPGVGAVFIEDVELSWWDELASVDSRLNGSEAAQNAHLLHVTDHRRDVETLEFGVDRV